MKKKPIAQLRSIPWEHIRDAEGYLHDEAQSFPHMLDTPVYRACREWLRAELRRRGKRPYPKRGAS